LGCSKGIGENVDVSSLPQCNTKEIADKWARW
jgi:hypothetical protein